MGQLNCYITTLAAIFAPLEHYLFFIVNLTSEKTVISQANINIFVNKFTIHGIEAYDNNLYDSVAICQKRSMAKHEIMNLEFSKKHVEKSI